MRGQDRRSDYDCARTPEPASPGECVDVPFPHGSRFFFLSVRKLRSLSPGD